MAIQGARTRTEGLTCYDVVVRHPRLGPLYRKFSHAVSPFDIINLYLVGHGLRMDPTHKFIVKTLNQDKRTILLHLSGIDYRGEPAQTIDGYQHNDASEFFYDPYEGLIYYDGYPVIDLEVGHVWRSPIFKQYYIRNLSVWDGAILVTDENDGYCPGGCAFCPKAELQWRATINTGVFLDRIMDSENLDSFGVFSEIAVVTSLFKNEDRGADYVTNLIKEASLRGFRGILNYLTCQFTKPDTMDRIAKTCKDYGVSFLHLHTVEKYFNRCQTMGAIKSKKDIYELKEIIAMAVSIFGSLCVGYNYILGLEPVERFREGLEFLCNTGAVPHPNIFAPFPKNYNTKLPKVRRYISGFRPTPEYVTNRIEYIVKCRTIYLELYRDQHRYYIQNNSGKLFPYPGANHFYGHHIRFGEVDLKALQAFDEWEKSCELDRQVFEREKTLRYEELQSRMLSNFDQIRLPILTTAKQQERSSCHE